MNINEILIFIRFIIDFGNSAELPVIVNGPCFINIYCDMFIIYIYTKNIN
jgi:hypothetical protein